MEHYQQLAHFFLDGDEERALQYIDQVIEAHPKLYLFEDLLTPAMYYIGKLWEQNKITVADEHLATAICDFVLTKLGSSLASKDLGGMKDKVLLFGVEEEQHYLGLKMVADTFKEKGWQVRYLGPNLPAAHAMKHITRYKPQVIGISAALSYRLPSLKKQLQDYLALDWKPTILIGGRMTRKLGLEEFLSEQVIVIKDLSQLNHWLSEGREGIFNESS
ncbi:cobalamin B12-binding domain-containing protein [Halobacillus ihumii]|uniref:cobalamin B12-binding domain-containing protein n=1 Tax=Halobacillus ihumii TaxID=2686092 RepID=UPI0013D7F106|nr:B12-binding domain-containing protein [Halobacillus ihumii]